WRGGLAGRLHARLGPDRAPVAAALLLADRGGLDPDVRRRFIDAGIVHLLAISGLHVGLIGGGLAWLVGLRVRGPRRLAWASALVGGYVLLIGAPASAVRAALLFAGYALTAVRGRPGRLGDLAALAGILAVLADPLVITDIGFQLSFAGFTGVVLGGRAARRLKRLPLRARRALEGLAVSSGAFLATAPLAAFHFDRVVLASIPASLVATGVVALALPAAALTLLLPGPLAAVFAPATEVSLATLTAIASAFAALPLRWTGPAPGPLAWAALACLAALAVDRARGRTGRPAWALGAAAGLLALAPALSAFARRGEALVCTLDVGQGDAAVVRTSAGRWLVLDAGPGRGFAGAGGALRPGPPLDARSGKAGREVVVPFLRARGARAIELFALSHPHLDHFGGAAALFDAFRVRRVLDPGVPEPSSGYAGFLERAREEGARWLPGLEGDRLRVDEATVEILWPSEEEAEGANEGSLVVRVTVDGFRYLNSGDAPASVERAIVARNGPASLEADLLKIGHHGSRTSTSRRWLDAADPEIAVISLGRGNRYGHPHPTVLARLDSTRARIWRTDRDETLCIAIRDGAWRPLEGV
ncbi:MAG: DNA internalization-related competence protein ComEC/Rec2, partial [Gemmatimonadota bacterium]|nr:DNA internalization-related competence protein ComEC/Rec2 [Gemmatimonadota bacterium]